MTRAAARAGSPSPSLRATQSVAVSSALTGLSNLRLQQHQPPPRHCQVAVQHSHHPFCGRHTAVCMAALSAQPSAGASCSSRLQAMSMTVSFMAHFHEMVSAASSRLACPAPCLAAASAHLLHLWHTGQSSIGSLRPCCDALDCQYTHWQRHAGPYAALDSSSKHRLCGRDAAPASVTASVYSSAAGLLLWSTHMAPGTKQLPACSADMSITAPLSSTCTLQRD